jgi:hypothetical protein
MHGYRAGQNAARARVLYMFRSPPNLQIGRKSMDAEVREALEHTHPDLTFDWEGLLREPMPPPRPDPRERGPRQRSQGRKEKPGRDNAPAAPPAQVVIDDQTLLGRTVGGAEAARLRARHTELSHRIARRARTPEERDRLGEAAQRLNPDSWSDETAIRAGILDIDARFDALAAELPRRRRGRRGGKAREDAPGQEAAGDVIIEQRDEEADQREFPDAPLAVDVPDVPSGSDPGGDPERAASAAPDAATDTAKDSSADAGTDPETDLH